MCKFGGEIPRVPGAAIKNPCLTVHFVLLGFSYWIFESNLTGQRQNRAPRNGIHSHAYAFCVKTLLHMQQKKDSPYTSIALFILLKKGNNFSLGLKTEHLPQSSTLFKYSTKSKKKKKYTPRSSNLCCQIHCALGKADLEISGSQTCPYAQILEDDKSRKLQ